MNERHDLALLIQSRIPIIQIESAEERRVLDLLHSLETELALALYVWSVTEGLHRRAPGYSPQRHNAPPQDVLGHIKSGGQAGMYVLLDFHPYLDDPVHVRLLKDIAQAGHRQTLILLSHALTVPPELRPYTARFELPLPGEQALRRLVSEVAAQWSEEHQGQRVKADPRAFDLLVRNLAGLTRDDARRLARKAIYNDGAVGDNDLPQVMQAKYALLNREGVLQFEHDTGRFSEVGGLRRFKDWLAQRRAAFLGDGDDVPRGVMLLGVQGCGKSLAAKAVAGVWGVPLLRLDFGALYNKFHGETERNLRAALHTAEVMAPCVLWIDEIEKGISREAHDGGTSQRVLGTLLTWMAERRGRVFLVATANDIAALPPELVRKGRLDEVFFVDLPDVAVRAEIFAIHLDKRGLSVSGQDLNALAVVSEGFAGAEIEQAVVSARYAAQAAGVALGQAHLLDELRRTRPLSVVMSERVTALRDWAASRTVPAA